MKEELEKKLVERYPTMFRDYHGDMTKTCMAFGCEHGDGWFWILDTMCRAIAGHEKYQKDKDYEPVVFQQVKEKFGTLNVYYFGGDSTTAAYIQMAELQSYYTCEVCGTHEDLGRTQGWIKVVCRSCQTKEHGNLDGWEAHG